MPWLVPALIAAVSLIPAVLFAAVALAAETSAPKHVGIYDSRLIAYAHFWTPTEQAKRETAMTSARAAQKSGAPDAAQVAGIAELQRRVHLQVFSTAPASEAMAALADKSPALQKELGIERFVSKWDTETLKHIPATRQIDVTDRLLREFPIPAERAKALDGIRKATPLPLAEAKRLSDAGKL